MYLDKCVEMRLEQCTCSISQLEELISALPPGTLYTCRNGNYFNWKVLMPDGRRIYLPKSDETTASLLAQKRVYQARLHDLKNEAEACRRYLRLSKNSLSAQDRLFMEASPELKRLIATEYKAKDPRIAKWENAEYEKFTGYPDQLIVPTLKPDLFVRSKVEADSCNELIVLGVPNVYEKMTTIGKTRIAVDITALDTRTFREIPIEIFGMMDNPEYRKVHNKKMANYIYAGYIPGVNFLALYESSKDPLSRAMIRKIFEDFFFNNPPRML